MYSIYIYNKYIKQSMTFNCKWSVHFQNYQIFNIYIAYRPIWKYFKYL